MSCAFIISNTSNTFPNHANCFIYGEGIAKSFDGLGQTITGYGNAYRTATAPNAGSHKTAVKKADSGSKMSSVGQKKALPSSGATKPLPGALLGQKLLMPPPPKHGNGTHGKTVAPFKQGGTGKKSTYAPSTAVSTVPNKTSQTAKSSYAKTDTTAVRRPAANKPATKPYAAPIKPTTNAAGETIVGPKSRPGNKSKTAAPKPSGSYQPKGGYQGPINLGGISAPTNTKSGGGSTKAPSVAGSVAGGGSRPKAGAYGGPLQLGGLA